MRKHSDFDDKSDKLLLKSKVESLGKLKILEIAPEIDSSGDASISSVSLSKSILISIAQDAVKS